MNNSRLVYSTETGRICPSCGKPKTKCACKKKKAAQPGNLKIDGIIRIQRETKGRKGKAVTSVYGFDSGAVNLKQIAARLKSRCGSGGSVKNGVIIIQGDHRKTIQADLSKQGYTVKLAGG